MTNSPCRAAVRRQGALLLICAVLILLLLMMLFSWGAVAIRRRPLQLFLAVLLSVFCAGSLLWGMYYLLFPSRSKLARSIRRALPAAAREYSGEELFALVDEDLRSPAAVRFCSLLVGEQWLLCGLFAMRIDQIQRLSTGVFLNPNSKDFHYHSHYHSHSRFRFELIIWDISGKKHRIHLLTLRQMEQAEDCLSRRMRLHKTAGAP